MTNITRANRLIGGILLPGLLVTAASCSTIAAETVIISEGKAQAIVCVPAGLMSADYPLGKGLTREDYEAVVAELQRRRLRDSVSDLCATLEKVSGARLAWHEGMPPTIEPGQTLILVGALAEAEFGPAPATWPGRQGWRLVVKPHAIGLIGESDLAISYAIYELLYQIGCRWYMPGELGECLPDRATITLRRQDHAATPATVYRNLWHPGFARLPAPSHAPIDSNDAFLRRNRQGGVHIDTQHNLEGLISAAQREEHPEWRAIINGQPDAKKLRWTNPAVAAAMAESIIAQLERAYRPVFPLGPVDSFTWDEADDPAADSGDWDIAMQRISKTDRLLVLVNRIAARVTEKYPEMRFSLLIYVDYTRPPLREKLHPSVIPYIAPIMYNRSLPMDAAEQPLGFQLREIVQGWQKAAPHLGFYWYSYNLAEKFAPNPLIAKTARDLPILFAAQYPYWLPETIPNFDTSLIGLYLGMSLSWDTKQDANAIVAELCENFYGAAATPMERFWRLFDSTWTDTGDDAGGALSFMRRFPPQLMRDARALMDEAQASCRTALELRRVQLAEPPLRRLDLHMKMRHDLAEGRLAQLETDQGGFTFMAKDRAERRNQDYAFGTTFDFYRPVFLDAGRIAREYKIVTPQPLRLWRFQADREAKAAELGWLEDKFDDSAWAKTDTAVDTWSALGLHTWFGAAMYRATAKLQPVPGKKLFLWLPGVDDEVRVWVNGREAGTAGGFLRPSSFDITAMARSGENTITLHIRRGNINEVGSGGLLGPALIYTEK